MKLWFEIMKCLKIGLGSEKDSKVEIISKSVIIVREKKVIFIMLYVSIKYIVERYGRGVGGKWVGVG